MSSNDSIMMYPHQGWMYRFWPECPVKHNVKLSAIALRIPHIRARPYTDRRVSAVTVGYPVNGGRVCRLTVGVLRIKPRSVLDNRSCFVDEAGDTIDKRFYPDMIRWLNYLVRPDPGVYVLGGDFDASTTQLQTECFNYQWWQPSDRYGYRG